MSYIRPAVTLAILATVTAATALADPPTTQPAPSSWPMAGGSPSRNAVAPGARVPSDWDLESGRNVKWSASLGSYSYAGPVIADGRVYVGTNNAAQLRPNSTGDKGCLLCFDAASGQLLWQATHDKLATGAVNDWPDQGIASTPYVDGDRVYYVSNRCELVCADARGFHDNENDGPITDEPFHDAQDADFIWVLDMIKELGVFPRNLAACAPVGAGDLIFVCTSNGVDDENGTPPAPQAPSFIAVNKNTGKLVWQRNDPGENILNGQWSSPAYGVIKGQPQVIFGGGDGWCYAFEPATGQPLWKFDLNPKDSVWKDGGAGTRTAIVAMPVIHNDLVYLAAGDDPESSILPGHLYAIDASQRGDITTTGQRWHVSGKEFSRTISTVAIADGLLYAADLNGYLSCFDAATGTRHWRYDMQAGVWASPTVIDHQVLLGNTDGELIILRHDKELKELARHDLVSAIYTTPAVVDGTLYIVTQKRLLAIADPTTTKPATTQPAAPTTTAAWPMFRGNPLQTGLAAANLPAQPAERWRRDTQAGALTTAAIAAGLVYVGSEEGHLLALNLADGQTRWQHTSSEPIESAPTVAAGLVIFGDDAGTLRACDALTGDLRWSFETDAQIISSANIAGDRLVFGSYDGGLYCLNLTDGRQLWKYTGVEERIHGTPGITGDNVLVAGCDARLHVVRLADGTPIRTIPLDSVTASAVAIGGDCAYLGCYNEFVTCVDWRAARVLWRYENSQRSFPFMSSAAVTDNLILIGGRDKRLHALDPATGRHRWEFVTRGRVDSSPVVVASRVFVGSADGNLYALDLQTGRETWRFEAGGGFYASPAVAADCLVIGTEEGVLYCFGAPQTTPRPA